MRPRQATTGSPLAARLLRLDRPPLRAHAQWSMAHRAIVMWIAATVVLSSIPLYTLVRQEYIPSNVDEAEFDVNVTAPQGISLAAMDEIMRIVEERDPCCAVGSSDALRCRWRLSRRRESGQLLCPHRAPRGADFLS